jgi:hypothetical protein|tara:strand:+ start:549 stop:815 length:267 start_codon:yes stop_codon:yes gene_type:complete
MAFKMKGNPMKRNFGAGSPIKLDKNKNTEAKADPKVGKQVAKDDYIAGSVETKGNKKIITFEDGSKGDMSKYRRGDKTLLEHLEAGTL